MRTKITLILSAILMISSVQAKELYLNLPQEAAKVVSPKSSALSLDDVKRIAVDEQHDIRMAYENLLQAQKKISLARAQYFPYGTGSLAMMYFLNVWNPIVLVELITSLPTKWYNVQSEKNMRRAQEYSLISLRENIKAQVATLYYTILKEETAMKLLKLEIIQLETLIKVFHERVLLGLSQEDEVRSLEIRLLDLRDSYLKFSAYFAVEKAAFNMMLTNSVEEAQKIELQPIAPYLSSSDYRMNVEAMVETALNRSPEITAADYTVLAARKAKKSVTWSILSFSGIGFGYWGRINIAGSKIDEAILNRTLVESTLKNQVYIEETAFHSTLSHYESEASVFSDTELHMQGQLEQFQAGFLSLDKLIESQFIYLRDYSELIISHYDALIKLEDLSRVVLGDVKQVTLPPRLVSIEYKQSGKWFFLYTHVDEKTEMVETVEYHFDDAGLDKMTSFNSSNNFAVKLHTPEKVSGFVKVILTNGEVTKKHFRF